MYEKLRKYMYIYKVYQLWTNCRSTIDQLWINYTSITLVLRALVCQTGYKEPGDRLCEPGIGHWGRIWKQRLRCCTGGSEICRVRESGEGGLIRWIDSLEITGPSSRKRAMLLRVCTKRGWGKGFGFGVGGSEYIDRKLNL